MRSSLSPDRQQEMIFCIAIIAMPFTFNGFSFAVPLPILIGFHSLLLYVLFGYTPDRRLSVLKGFLSLFIIVEVLLFIYEVGAFLCTIYPCR